MANDASKSVMQVVGSRFGFLVAMNCMTAVYKPLDFDVKVQWYTGTTLPLKSTMMLTVCMKRFGEVRNVPSMKMKLVSFPIISSTSGCARMIA